jgi:hypothetical protein
MHLKNITPTFCLFAILQLLSCKENNNSDCLVDADKFRNAYNYPDLQNKRIQICFLMQSKIPFHVAIHLFMLPGQRVISQNLMNKTLV